MMDSFLCGLFTDLLNRCQTVQATLKNKTPHPDLVDYQSQILVWLKQIESDILSILADPQFLSPRLLKNRLQQYSQFSQVMRMLEAFPITTILRYEDNEHYFFALLQRIVSQISYTHPVPIVSTFSKDYYWALPEFNLLAVPPFEEFSLLSLPDLLHELAHVLIRQHQKEFIGRFAITLKMHFRQQRQYVQDQQKPPGYDAMIQKIQEQWIDEWLAEFASDMIATFLVGPAYGWAHIRLCASQGNSVFLPGPDKVAGASHPADNSRMDAILKILDLLKLEVDSKAIKQHWEEYHKRSGHKMPQDYALCYPILMIEKLAEKVFEACRGVKLRAYTDQAALPTNLNVPILLNQAWQQFRLDPKTYPEWEKRALEGLRESVKC